VIQVVVTQAVRFVEGELCYLAESRQIDYRMRKVEECVRRL